jgi:hypothetical protein
VGKKTGLKRPSDAEVALARQVKLCKKTMSRPAATATMTHVAIGASGPMGASGASGSKGATSTKRSTAPI